MCGGLFLKPCERAMRRYFALLTLLLASTALADATAFVNVNVVPMSSDTIIEQQTTSLRGVYSCVKINTGICRPWRHWRW